MSFIPIFSRLILENTRKGKHLPFIKAVLRIPESSRRSRDIEKAIRMEQALVEALAEHKMTTDEMDTLGKVALYDWMGYSAEVADHDYGWKEGTFQRYKDLHPMELGALYAALEMKARKRMAEDALTMLEELAPTVREALNIAACAMRGEKWENERGEEMEVDRHMSANAKVFISLYSTLAKDRFRKLEKEAGGYEDQEPLTAMPPEFEKAAMSESEGEDATAD